MKQSTQFFQQSDRLIAFLRLFKNLDYWGKSLCNISNGCVLQEKYCTNCNVLPSVVHPDQQCLFIYDVG